MKTSDILLCCNRDEGSKKLAPEVRFLTCLYCNVRILYLFFLKHADLCLQYEKAASILSASDPPLVLAKVDATDEENRGLSRSYELRGLPSLKILRYGGSFVHDYKGPKDADGIVEYVKRQSGPASLEIKSSEDAISVVDSYKILVVSSSRSFSFVHDCYNVKYLKTPRCNKTF